MEKDLASLKFGKTWKNKAPRVMHMAWHIFPTWEKRIDHADISALARACHLAAVGLFAPPPPLTRVSGFFTV
jgi:hypothetical protein